MRAFTFILSLSLFPCVAWTQETKPAPRTSYSPIPVTEARRPNPVKPTPESLAEGKKIYAYDCAQCHGNLGDGKTDPGKKMKIPDLTDPSALKNRTDGELFYVINKGHGEMPLEGNRVTPEQTWDLVNYVRSLATPKKPTE